MSDIIDLDPVEIGHTLAPYSDGRIWEEHQVLTEICFHTEQIVHSAYEIGRRLIWTKEVLGHGQFLTWCEANLPFSMRTIQNYMRVANFLVANPRLLKPMARAGMKRALLLTSLPQELVDEVIADGNLAEVPLDELGDVPYVDLKKEVVRLQKEREDTQLKLAQYEREGRNLKEALGEQTAERSKIEEFAHNVLTRDAERFKAEIARLAGSYAVLTQRWDDLPHKQRAEAIALWEGLQAHLEYERVTFQQAIGQEVYGHQLAEALNHARATGHAIDEDRVLPFVAAGR